MKFSVECTKTKPSSIAGLHSNTLVYSEPFEFMGVKSTVKRSYIYRTPEPIAVGTKSIIDTDYFHFKKAMYDIVDETSGEVKAIPITTISRKSAQEIGELKVGKEVITKEVIAEQPQPE